MEETSRPGRTSPVPRLDFRSSPMRTIWNGSISFGLVSIPVGLALATKPAARQSDVSFRQLHRECRTPIKQKRWCPTHDREVGPDEIVRGWEVAKGEFVIVEDADLEAIERNYFDRTYCLAPSSTAAQRRPYVLLLEAMKETEMAALGRFILRGQEHFSLIRARGNALVLETLFVAEDVNSQAEIEEAVSDTKVKDAELELARQVIESLEGDFVSEDLQSEYRRDLRAMLEAKLAGEEIARPEPVAEEAPVVDLLEALRQSVAEASKGSSRKKAPAKKKAAARPKAKAAARKSA